MLHSHTIDN